MKFSPSYRRRPVSYAFTPNVWRDKIPACAGMTVFIMLLCTTPAHAQQIRDMSMTPEESLSLPDVSHAPAAPYGYGAPAAAPSGLPGRDLVRDMGNESDIGPASRFMDGYCDPGFQPLAAAGNQPCLDAQKQQSCTIFRQLPAPAQRAIDDTISCLYTATDDGDGTAIVQTDPACAENDTRRLHLLKQYWQYPDVARALVFLPDQVLNAPAHCLRGGR